VLVGTVSVDVSETLSRMLKRRGIPHEVLNAKYHGREAQIVAEAGQPGAVTIATNMAGRGTDIKLGPGVKEPRTLGVAAAGSADLSSADDPATRAGPRRAARRLRVRTGGLHIIGSERHESRRIDRQLRGRAGRQGDPGASQFFLSLEDDLMRLFGSERIAGVMDRMGAEEGEVITHALITRSIGNAQKRVEMQNFEARKRLLDYDDVMNQQREVIYDLRTFALEGGEDLKGEAWDMIEKTLDRLIEEHAPEGTHAEEWELAELRRRLLLDFFLTADRLPRRTAARRRLRGPGGAARVPGRARPRQVPRPALEQFGPLRVAAPLHRAEHHRRALEGPPLRPRPPEGVDRLPRLGPEGPADRVQEGGVRHVRRPDDGHPVVDRAAALPRAARGNVEF
jgi:preprotein translocase subunit SecA